jgi:hypothetical protein
MASLTWIAIVSGGSVCAIASRGSRFHVNLRNNPTRVQLSRAEPEDEF